LYEYRCTSCGYTFEKIQSFSAEPERECPKCQGVLIRPVTAPALRFEGAGWYVNDYAGKGGAKAGEAAKGAEGAAGAEASGESKADSKAESKSDSATGESKSPAAAAATAAPSSTAATSSSGS
jgi:putative FmdB family regulatory protein